MSDSLYRVVYRPASGSWYNGDTSWWMHTSSSGTSSYGTVGAARGAVTQFRKRDRMSTYEYKIQVAPVGDWEDVTL